MTDKRPVKPASHARNAVLGFLMIPLVIAFWAGLIWIAVWFFFSRS